MKEAELRPPVLAHLERQGYRAWAAPDGHDYFDIAAVRGDEVGLVELKIADAKAVFGQALRRRAWADWVAVALPGLRSARRLAAIRTPERADRVGVWLVRSDRVEELRPARPLYGPGEPDPFAPSRGRLRTLLQAIERGEVSEEFGWGFVGSPPIADGRRRSTATWRLDEFG